MDASLPPALAGLPDADVKTFSDIVKVRQLKSEESQWPPQCEMLLDKLEQLPRGSASVAAGNHIAALLKPIPEVNRRRSWFYDRLWKDTRQKKQRKRYEPILYNGPDPLPSRTV